MTTAEIVSFIITALFTGGLSSWGTVWINAKRSKKQSKNEEKQTENEARGAYTNEFEAVVSGMSTTLDQVQEENLYIRGEMQLLREDVNALRAELSEEKRFVEMVRQGVQAGTVPPWPDRYGLNTKN